ncbi:GlsB/YeaQ/YmgE family stress response membrane protein [Actinoallomurus sp. NPDC050550]|uniref:GlsB/YeaQ/YmgE family stress response membrane protein n=1 Tax=Actinoallomurus sp. NPDC050550 TaxID=3154937 RepID=UPI0033CBEA6C
MGIIAWIILGLVAGMVARMLVPGRDRNGLVITTLIGIAGALLGGFLATRLFHVAGTRGFFDLSTWITAIVGAAVLLLAYHLVTGQSSGRRFGRRVGHR